MHQKLTHQPGVLFFSLLLSNALVAADWPQWMGPNLAGVSAERGWSTDWPEDGLQEVWSKEIGIGFSSVSVVDGRLYTMGHSDGEETVWCLDAESGETVWSHTYEAELNANLYEGGPGSTPTVRGDSVFTLSVDGRLLSLNRVSGDVQWEVNLRDELDVELHEWGFNSSPFLLKNQLLVECGRLASFDVRDGKKIWQSEEHLAGYGSVRSFESDGETLLASIDCEGLRISRADDGSEVAFREWKSPYRTNSTTPIIAGDHIFISTGYNVGSALFRFRNSELDELYTSKRMRNHFNNSILFDGHLYGFDGNSNLGRVVTLTCMNFETGEVMWKERGLGCGSLMIADGKLVVLSEKGELVIAGASSSAFREEARAKILDGRCWTVPVLLNGCVFARNANGRLVCVKLPPR